MDVSNTALILAVWLLSFVHSKDLFVRTTGWQLTQNYCSRQREEITRLTKKSSLKTKNWTEPERKQG